MAGARAPLSCTHLAAGVHGGRRAKVNQADVAICADKDVLRFDVAVHVAHLVHGVNGEDHLGEVKFGGVLLQRQKEGMGGRVVECWRSGGVVLKRMRRKTAVPVQGAGEEEKDGPCLCAPADARRRAAGQTAPGGP